MGVIHEEKTLSDGTNVAGYHYLQKILDVQSGCGGSNYVESVETINLGCGISGTPSQYCPVDADKPICKVTLGINKNCYNSVGGVRVVNDVCCSGGSGLVISYKSLRFTDCGLFTGVAPYNNCNGEIQPSDWNL